MANYQYRCPSCRNVFITLSRTEIPPCPACNYKRTLRDFSFNIASAVTEHFNYSTGEYVSNERVLRDVLKRQSDAESERLGMDHNYEYLSPHDMADASSHGVTEEGLDRTHQTIHDQLMT